MKNNPSKATPRVYHTLRQIVQRIPRWLIEKTANAYGVDARKFSATSHFVMLILGHLSRASCLTEICDDADLNKRKLSLVRNATPGKRNTFSHVNPGASGDQNLRCIGIGRRPPFSHATAMHP